MVGGGDPDWAEIRRAYDGYALSLAQICAQFGVTKPQVTKRRNAEGWTPRPLRWRRRDTTPEAMGKPCRPLKPAHVAQKVHDKAPGPMKQAVGSRRRKLINRLYNLIDKKLASIEERMENSDGMTPADSERDVRSIGALIRSLEKLTEFDDQDRGGTGRKGADTGISADEADRLRRELKSRIERMCRGKPA